MKRLALLLLLLVSTLALTAGGCAKASGAGNSNQADDGGVVDGGGTDGGGTTDAQVVPSGPTHYTLTNGGGSVSSPRFQGRITIGAPHPGGQASGPNHNLQTGQQPNR